MIRLLLIRRKRSTFRKGLKESPRLIIRDRSADICGDTVSMNLIISDDLNNSDADIYVMTHTTNPILSSKTIANAIMAYKKGKKADKSDSLFTVNKHQTRFYESMVHQLIMTQII